MSQSGFTGTKVAILGGEAAELRSRLEAAGGTVVAVPADVAFGQAHASDFGGLVLADGLPAPVDAADPKGVQLVREFMVADKPVAAIGSGVSLLVAADAVAGRSVAVPDGLADVIRQAGGEMVDAAIHADDKLITARSNAELPLVAERVMRAFASQIEERQLDQVSEQSFPASDPPPGPGAIGAARGDRSAGPDVRL